MNVFDIGMLFLHVCKNWSEVGEISIGIVDRRIRYGTETCWSIVSVYETVMQSGLLLRRAKVNRSYFFAVLTAPIFTVIEVHDAMILW